MTVKQFTFSGSRFDIGVQVGQTFAHEVQWAVDNAKKRNPPPMPADEVANAVKAAWAASNAAFPAVMQEIKGIAFGAGVPVLDLFLDLYEELWDDHERRPAPEVIDTGCTDIVATRSATKNGTTLIGHNDDVGDEAGPPHMLVYQFDDGTPTVRGVSLGCRTFSAGQNAAGLILTGNTLISSDAKVGIPRLIITRAILDARTIEEGVKITLHPDRASVYNNIIADRTGRVIDIEPSSTKAAYIPLVQDRLVHTNHFLHPDMLAFEAKHLHHRSSSLIRYEVATHLLYARGEHTPDSFRTILSNHKGYPSSVCRHGQRTKTQFAVIYEAETGKMWLHMGHPCQWASPLP